MTSVFEYMLKVELAIRFKKVENGKKEWDEAPSHSLVGRREFFSLSVSRTQENLFRDPFAHEEGELGGNMQAVPKTTEMVKGDFRRLICGVEAESIRGYVVVQVMANDGRLIQAYESMPRFGYAPQVEYIRQG